MAMMFNIMKKANNADALIRIYKNEFHLNAQAVKLLGIETDKHSVRITYDHDELTCGRMRIYISICDAYTPGSFPVHPKDKEFRVYNHLLCTVMADNLEGYGVYRICPEVNKTINGQTYYEIFFKRYK